MSSNLNSVSPEIIELLAPAKNAATAIAALNCGADAVYMGATGHGARKQAANSIDDVRQVAEYAHLFGARVYVTVNTIVYESEIKEVERLIWDLWRVGADALIVQDMGILEMRLPPIALHASTQCDIRTPEKARFLEACGFSQLVLPRELSVAEIKEFRAATSVPLEAFVHGALCVSYSGDCQASFALTGRSANRGECAQICRYKFNLEDGSGAKIAEDKYLLSLKDMNRLDSLDIMLEAGISSFKIEGRLKDEGYVKNVVGAYSGALDRIIARSDGRYKRRARGAAELPFVPDVAKSFNRGFTSYFLHDVKPGKGTLASFGTPKWIGEEVGVVERQLPGGKIKIRPSKILNNGDGLGYFDGLGKFCGFRLNRVDGNILYPASDIDVHGGTQLYRNSDKAWTELIGQEAKRRVTVDMRLRVTGTTAVLGLTDEDGVSFVSSCDIEPQRAKTPQQDGRRRALAKLGDTIFRLGELKDEAGDIFIPLSVLSNLRREGAAGLENVYRMRMPVELRGSRKEHIICYKERLTRHDNVANSLAREFYKKKASADCSAEALEVSNKGLDEDSRIMQTRYCLRREMGACLKTSAGRMLPAQLYLTSGNTRLRLEFDCFRCRMNVHLDRK